jgi:hypothetical protein
MADTALDEREPFARIDQMHAAIQQALADDDKKPLEPWKVLIAGVTELGAWSAFLVFALAHWWRP